MSQYVINIGALPNDGTGDPLRTAFNETNLNFNQVFAAGPVLSNIQIANNTILTTNTNGNLILNPNGIGIIQANAHVIPDQNRIRNLGSSALKWNNVYTQYISIAGDASIGGNLSVVGNVIQIGNIVTDSLTIQLANTAANASSANGAGLTVGLNDNIATVLYNSTGNVWTTNIGISSVGNITAPYFIGNGSLLTGLAATYGNANVVANLAALGSNPVSTTGNVTGGFIFGNISLATGFPATYGNANVANYLPTFSGNISAGNVSATGNISGAYVKGNGSELTNLPAPTVTQDITSNGAMSIMTYDGVIKYVNYATVEPSSGNITGGNIRTTGVVTATGNITGNYFIGNGSQLTGISASSNKIFNGNSYANIASADGNLVVNVGNDGYGIWTFAAGTGNLVGPGNASQGAGIVFSADQSVYIREDMGELKIDSGSGIEITTNSGNVGNTQSWTFDNSGNLNLPNNGDINFNGGSIAQTLNEDIYIRASDDESDGWSIYNVVDDGVGNILSQTRLEYNQYSIRTDAQGAAYTWAFRDSGVLDLPGDIYGNVGGNLTIKIGDQAGSDTFIDLQTRSYVGDALISNIRIANPDVTVSTASAAYNWTFDNAGNLNLPPSGNIVGVTANNSGYINWLGNSSGDGYGYTTMRLVPDDTIGGDSYLIIDPTAPNHIHIRAGGTQDNSSAQLFLGGENSYFLVENGANSNVYVASNSNQWKFDTTGVLTLPGEGVLQSIDDTVTLQSFNTSTGNANSVYLGTSGGLGFNDQEIGGNWLEIFRTGTEPEIRVPVGRGNLNIQTAQGNTAYNWVFDDTGNLSTPGSIILPSNSVLTGQFASPAPSINGFDSISAVNLSATGNVTGGNILTGGQIISTGAGNTATNGGQIFLNGATLNRIDWNTNGTGAPEYTTRSAGAKVVLYPSIGGSATDYALGVEAGALWSGIPGNDSGQFFKWYGGNVPVASLSGTGFFSAAGNVTASSLNGNANISNVTINSYTSVPQLWFKGTLSTDQSLTTSNDTIILYNTNTDPLSWGTTASSNGRIVPNKSGWYEVVSRVQFSAIAGNTAAQINHQIAVNGVQQAISQVPNNAVVGAGVAMISTAMVNLNGTTDYITTSCYTTVTGQTCVGSTSTMLLVKWIST